MALIFGLSALLLAQLTQSYPYSMYDTKRYPRTGYQPAYIPVPVPYNFPPQDGMDDMSLPNYRYYYYPVHADTRYGFYEDPTADGASDANNEFGQEMWYENGEENNAARAAANAEADAAFLRNLIITQMYQDAAASAAVGSGNPSRYAYPQYLARANQENNEKNWLYGIPTTEIEDKERIRNLPKNNEDEEVKELESLRKAANKEGKRRRKQKAKEARENSREKKDDSSVSLVTSKPLIGEGSTAISSRKNRLVVGQKEVAEPQPARRVRQPFAELTQRLHTRSDEPSAYQTIKQLLAMENNYKKTEDSRLQKRFVSTEEQLTQQLSSLKKSTL